jgi:hypothetical protein
MAVPDIGPERAMQVTLELADFGQVSEGKLNVMGAGWTVTGPDPIPFAIVGIVRVPWNETNRPHEMRFELIDLDGAPVMVDGPSGTEAVALGGPFEVGRPPGVRPGSFIPMPFAINCAPIPLPPGSHFEWRFSIDGQAHEDWRLAFSTRPDAQSKAA